MAAALHIIRIYQRVFQMVSIGLPNKQEKVVILIKINVVSAIVLKMALRLSINQNKNLKP